MDCDDIPGLTGFINTFLWMGVKLKNKDTLLGKFFALLFQVGCHIKQGGKFNEKTN
jgi:hypothetical protein